MPLALRRLEIPFLPLNSKLLLYIRRHVIRKPGL